MHTIVLIIFYNLQHILNDYNINICFNYYQNTIVIITLSIMKGVFIVIIN